MATNSHAILSASGSHRWLECTPSARLSENFEDVTSSYALEGSMVHLMCEIKLCKALGLPCDEKLPQDFEITQEMEDSSDAYVEYILDILGEIKKTCKDPVVLIEQRLDFSNYVPEGYGTGDCVIVADGIIHIIDYKNGSGVKVDSYENPQMKLYALGALNLLDCLYNINTVSMTIFQPRIANISTYEMEKDKLIEWANNVLVPRAKLAYEGKGEFVPGDHCRFCKCKIKCTARALANLQLASYEFKTADLLDDDEIEDIIGKIDNLVEWGNSIKEYALNEALKGKKWSKYKLVEGRSNRKFKSEEEVAKVVSDAGYDPYDKKLLSITDMTKLLGKAKFVELLDKYIYKPQGKPTLVSIEDKRPEMNLAVDDFKNAKE